MRCFYERYRCGFDLQGFGGCEPAGNCEDAVGWRKVERFEITQPTLSHHMKILVECGLVNARKDGKWQHYSLNCETLTQFKEFIEGLTCCGSNSEGGCCS